MSYEKTGEEIIFHDADKKITIVNTGLETQTGGRLKRLELYLKEPFFMTYGDGLSNVPLLEVIDTFIKNESLVTVTAVHPAGRFGSVYLDDLNRDKVVNFGEKTDGKDWINGGFMVVHPDSLSYICNGDVTNWEADVLPNIAYSGRMTAYRHEGFWTAVDTLRDKFTLEDTFKRDGAMWLEHQNIGKIKKY